MDRDTLEEIREFAVKKEIEAVQLYSHMASRVQQAHVRSLFEELAEEERKHRRMLQELDFEGIAASETGELGPVVKIELSDYLVEQEFRPDMSLQDALILALKREEKSWHLYRNLASGTSGELRKVFDSLAGEEAKHKERLQKQYDEGVLTEN